MDNTPEKKKKKHSVYLDAQGKAQLLPFIPFNLPKISYKRSYMTLGVFACMAMGTFTFASSFKSAPSTDSNKTSYVQTNSTNQTAQTSTSEKNQAAEIESLRKQVQATSRKFKEYQAQLFRSSHPKDQNKIAELGQLLSEKEKANNQLSNSLKALEKELAAAHKQIANLEVASDALNSLLNANRLANEQEIKALKHEITQLSASHESEKHNLLAKIEAYENEKQKISSEIATFENTKKNLTEKIELYENEKQNIIAEKELLETERQNLIAKLQSNENDKQALLDKLVTYEEEKEKIINKMVSYENDQQNIINELEKKYASIYELKDEELQLAKESVKEYEERIAVVENEFKNSQILFAEISSKFEESFEKHASSQQELAKALEELENSKSSLSKLQDSSSELASLKERLEKQRFASEEDYEETLAIIHSYYQTSLDEVSEQLKEIHKQLTNEEETKTQLQQQLDHALAQQQNFENMNQEQQHQINTLSKDLIETKFKFVFNEQYIAQLNEAVAQRNSQHKTDSDKLHATLEAERSERDALQKQILALNEEKASLESLKETHEKELASHKQQAQIDKASAELSFVVRETELTAYQLMLQIEIERLNAEISENTSKIHPQAGAEGEQQEYENEKTDEPM